MEQQLINYWPLVGIVIIIVGFLIRLNPVLVVTIAGVVAGLLANLPLYEVMQKLGSGFLNARNLALILLIPLAVIGLLERHGLREFAQQWIMKIERATVSRLLITYLFIREVTAAIGLTSLGGHAQMVRPLIAPMAEGTAIKHYGSLPDKIRDRILAMAAACDNVGLFFGEDIFVAFGAVIFMQGFLSGFGIHIAPLHIALWGIPTAICAFLIHCLRIIYMDRKLHSRLTQSGGE
ncbi:DUF969 domain-containing protein [Orbaceae bacterium ESL0721]|nr:DUF969 domain-containing protein [Orbaceae bacterium ESL0721]